MLHRVMDGTRGREKREKRKIVCVHLEKVNRAIIDTRNDYFPMPPVKVLGIRAHLHLREDLQTGHPTHSACPLLYTVRSLLSSLASTLFFTIRKPS